MDEHGGADPGTLGVDSPWQQAAVVRRWEPEADTDPDAGAERESPAVSATVPRARREDEAAVRSAVYREVQDSAAFREVRARYRGFAFPAAAVFVSWYLLYVVMATTAPGLMAHQVAGQLNVAMVAGLAQFATTFLLTWAYARHARLRRDRAALDLRWTLATRTGQERVR
ncbi:Uncharacterized membrane protein, DUF485 family [Actinacidiphila yanglinensis]|uniref:Uncharacterized membrane protein, DUF485 family n=1 Tax=Actinacidiphila yanglinensis TaxID=310779 RepID=A0A1H5X1Z6_9ACTN|nr:DUF485 domain-containing protein [Actinacidiphila yanglinensis]SEG05864.1 Uncharacterized membrane protein, DUF485 family [Actinacidiphila yanglinensis]